MTTPPPKPLSEQVQIILARYRNMDLSKENDRTALGQMIAESTLPTYHKEVMMTVLLTKDGAEMILSLELVRMQERSRHLSAMMAVESHMLQERLRRST